MKRNIIQTLHQRCFLFFVLYFHILKLSLSSFYQIVSLLFQGLICRHPLLMHAFKYINIIMSRIPPFHLAIPVHNLSVAMNFYGRVMGCIEGRKCKKNKWIDYKFYGHQLVLHVAHENYKPIDHFNPVDGDEVPLPHFGLCLSIQDWKDMRDKLVAVQTKFIIQPRLRFAGQEGEQYTMFFKDPTGNNLEMKAMIKPENLFKHYEVQ